jgi:two-component system NtrC family response regulator
MASKNAPVDRKIMIVEDDPGLQRQLRWAFEDYEVLTASNREAALGLAERERPPVVLLDLGLPPDADGPSEGLATLRGILDLLPDTKVIMMTGQADRSYAVQAVARGAYDFYQKPVDADILNLIVTRAHALWTLEDEHRKLAKRGGQEAFPDFLTAHPPLQETLDRVRDVADSDIAVLITGESGTGKELVAKGVHDLSRRARGPFIAINCAAIPDHLLESELFGHEKGAFTGAVKTTEGKVEQASGGTLFLDEIGDLSLTLQAKLLRFLQEKVIERVGGRRLIEVNVRVISATNRNLGDAIKSGVFREDLYYRLSEYSVELPPLRERGDDAVVIANELLLKLAQEYQRPVRGFANDAVAAIAAYPWPGNVRELVNRIKRAVVTARGRKATAVDLDLAAPGGEPKRETLQEARDRAERAAIENAIAHAGGNISTAAKLLKVSRPKLYNLLRRHSIET